MPEKIMEYLTVASEQIRWRRVRPVLMSELRTHLLEQRDACAEEGMDEAAAEAEALRQMGDPITVGQALDRVHRPAPQWGLLLLTGLLVLTGGVLRILFAAEPDAYARTAVFLVLGLACLLGGYVLDYTVLGRYAKVLYWGTVILGAAALRYPPVYGARYAYYGVNQYAQYVVMLFPVVYALMVYSLHGKGWRGLFLAMAYAVPLLLIAAEAPSVIGFLICLIAFVLLLNAIRKGWFRVPRGRATGLLMGLAAAGALLMVWPARGGIYRRVMLALHPKLDADGAGYVGSVILEILSGAKLWGEGPLGGVYGAVEGRTYWNTMPGAQTDFLLTTLIHFAGWIPFLLLCGGLLGLVGWAAVKCHRQGNALGRMVAMAIVLTLGGQIVISILMNLGFLLLSASCPFIVGDVLTMLNMALMGLLLSVFRQERIPAAGSRAAPLPSEKRKLVSWQDGDLVIALGRRDRE